MFSKATQAIVLGFPDHFYSVKTQIRNPKKVYVNDLGIFHQIKMKNDRPEHCIQVCYHLTDMNMNRELNGLKTAINFFKMKDGTIVTHNQTDLIETDGSWIKLIPAWKYFLND